MPKQCAATNRRRPIDRHRQAAQFLGRACLCKNQVSVSNFLFRHGWKIRFRDAARADCWRLAAKRRCGDRGGLASWRLACGARPWWRELRGPNGNTDRRNASAPQNQFHQRGIHFGVARCSKSQDSRRRNWSDCADCGSLSRIQAASLNSWPPKGGATNAVGRWSIRQGSDRPTDLRCTASGSRRSARRPTARPSLNQ